MGTVAVVHTVLGWLPKDPGVVGFRFSDDDLLGLPDAFWAPVVHRKLAELNARAIGSMSAAAGQTLS